MKAKIILIILLMGVGMYMSGCKTQPMAGVVGLGDSYPARTKAPDIPFLSKDGRQTTLLKESQPIVILGFTGASVEECGRLAPKLIELTDRFKNEPITVAQVCTPLDRCARGPGCSAVCNLDVSSLVSLCDRDLLAWTAYGKPKTERVFLIDEYGDISMSGGLNKVDDIADRAEQMALRIKAMDTEWYGKKTGE